MDYKLKLGINIDHVATIRNARGGLHPDPLKAMPEAKLAREAEMRYVSIAMVTDYDCWHETEENVDVTDIIKVLNENAENAQLLVKAGRFQHFHLVL
jgi:pyridoxine 5'-phosphate synthase PdxJ